MSGKDQRRDTLLLQFARTPREGAVKTRMQPVLSPGESCELHWSLLAWTHRQLAAARLGDLELWLSEPPDAKVAQRLSAMAGAHGRPLVAAEPGIVLQSSETAATAAPPAPTRLRIQGQGDLGLRMQAALGDGLRRYRRVILVGSDCPGLDADYLAEAVESLARAELVVGPAEDGGYVLIGARRVESSLFEAIGWGGSAVYRDTVARLDASDLSWRALPLRRDVDRPEDLPWWRALQAGEDA